MDDTRSTHIEVEERISQIFRWRLEGLQRHDIIQLAAEKGWGVSDRQVDAYTREAKARLVEFNKDTQEQDLAYLTSLHFENYKTAEPRDRTAILREIARLKGLDEITIRVAERPLKDIPVEALMEKLKG